MKWLRKLKYVLPLFLILAFPLYFKLVCDSYAWLADDKFLRFILALLTVAGIGMSSYFFLEEIFDGKTSGD